MRRELTFQLSHSVGANHAVTLLVNRAIVRGKFILVAQNLVRLRGLCADPQRRDPQPLFAKFTGFLSAQALIVFIIF